MRVDVPSEDIIFFTVSELFPVAPSSEHQIIESLFVDGFSGCAIFKQIPVSALFNICNNTNLRYIFFWLPLKDKT